MSRVCSFVWIVCAASALFGSGSLNARAAVSPGLIKASGPVIFYLATNGRRYAFPNEQTFRTWYVDFSGIRTVSDTELSRYGYGGNVTYRPGTRLLKRQNTTSIYTVQRGGMLRLLTGERMARTLYGSNWARLMDVLPEARVVDYVFGDEVRVASEVSPRADRDAAPTIEQNRRTLIPPMVRTAISPPPVPPVISPLSRAPIVFPVTPLPTPSTPMRPTVVSPPPPAPRRSIVWPGQVTRTPSVSVQRSQTPSPISTIISSQQYPTPAIDLSPYPGALRAVSSTTEATLRSAIQNAHPGDVIRVFGSYILTHELRITAKGTQTNPIYVVAANGPGSARLTMSGTEEGIHVTNGAQHLVFDGLLFVHAGKTIVHVEGHANNITLRNLTLSDAGSDGNVIKISQADHVVIEGCDLARSGRSTETGESTWQEVIDVTDADNITIHRNWIHDFGNMAGSVKGGSEAVQITDNLIDGQRLGTATDPAWGIGGWEDATSSHRALYQAVGTNFQHNVIAHASYGALGLYDAYHANVGNNLFLNNNGVIVQIRSGNGLDEATDGVEWSESHVIDTRGSMPNVCEIQSHALRNFHALNTVYWNRGLAIPDEADCGFVPGAESGARIVDPRIEDIRITTLEQAMALVDRVLP